MELSNELLDFIDDKEAPIEILKWFIDSYVKIDFKNESNNYIIKNNVPYISIARIGFGIQLFHEIGHFVLAPMHRLHIDNYGYKIPKSKHQNKLPKKWADLDIEIQVTAIELNLTEIFYEDQKIRRYAAQWSYLLGWKNYCNTHNVSHQQMVKKVEQRIKYWKSIYDYNWIEKEWRQRNNILKMRMHKNGTIAI
jgi:hypothetical protein